MTSTCVLLVLASAFCTVSSAQETAPGDTPWIVFGSFRGGDYSSSVHAVRPDGTGEVQLSLHPSGRPGCLDPWAALDGSRILFTRGGDGSHRVDVWAMAGDGTGEAALTDRVMTRFRNGRAWPGASPDGEHVVYVSEAGGTRSLVVAKADGSEPRTLCPGEFPAWSPVDDRILFVADDAGTDQVWSVDAAGGEPVRLTSGAEAGFPSWSPDGTEVLYSLSVGSSADLFLVPSEGGGEPLRLTDTPGRSELQATISPDGAWIAFTARPADAPGGWERSVYVMPAVGGDARQVTPSAHNDGRPTWITGEPRR